MSVNGTHFYLGYEDTWEAWISPERRQQCCGFNLETNEIDYIEVGTFTKPEGASHFSRRGEIDQDYFFTHSDNGGQRINLDTYEVSASFELPGQVSRMAVVSDPGSFDDSGDNRLYADYGGDTVAGGLGDDIILGNDGADVLRGDLDQRSAQDDVVGGNDVIFGGGGDDRIGGKSGDDVLLGEAGDDQIWGDDGNDILIGGAGNDTLTGDNASNGVGEDLFVFGLGDGIDIITDFQVGFDQIGLVSGELTFADLEITQEGNNTVLGVSGSGETLAVLQGVQSGLGEASFTIVADVTNPTEALALI